MNILEKFGIPIYFVSISVLYLSYFLIFFGVLGVNISYIHYLSIFVHVFICLFLIIRFNPFIIHVLRPYDGNVIFGSAILLLFNVVFTEIGITDKASPFQNITKYFNIKINSK